MNAAVQQVDVEMANTNLKHGHGQIDNKDKKVKLKNNSKHTLKVPQQNHNKMKTNEVNVKRFPFPLTLDHNVMDNSNVTTPSIPSSHASDYSTMARVIMNGVKENQELHVYDNLNPLHPQHDKIVLPERVSPMGEQTRDLTSSAEGGGTPRELKIIAGTEGGNTSDTNNPSTDDAKEPSSPPTESYGHKQTFGNENDSSSPNEENEEHDEYRHVYALPVFRAQTQIDHVNQIRNQNMINMNMYNQHRVHSVNDLNYNNFRIVTTRKYPQNSGDV